MVLFKTGFGGLSEPDSWVNLIMFIVSTNTISLLWNKERLSELTPSRGIGQGLGEPYLIVWRNSHISLVRQLKQEAGNPFEITTRGPFLSHLSFADDLLLFGETCSQQLNVMKDVWNRFCEASGA